MVVAYGAPYCLSAFGVFLDVRISPLAGKHLTTVAGARLRLASSAPQPVTRALLTHVSVLKPWEYNSGRHNRGVSVLAAYTRYPIPSVCFLVRTVLSRQITNDGEL